MSKKVEINIKEDNRELNILKRQQKSLSKQKRIIALQRIKNSKDATRQELANYLNVNRKTLRRWLMEYNEGGIESIVALKPRRKGSNIISEKIHAGLQSRVNDPKNSFLGYWDAQRWIESEYGVKVKYQRVREYLIKHFGTSVKRPRKSHVKKDERAIALFKNVS